MRILIAILVTCTLGCTPRPRAPSNPDGDLSVARVGQTVITDKDLMGRIAVIEKSFPRTYSTHIQKKQLLEEMVHIELLYQQAIELGLDKRYEFKSRLADLYIQQLAERAREKITEKEVLEEFELNKAEYQQVSARHILLKFGANESEKTKAELKKKISGIRAEALKDPSRFKELAIKYSQDGSASNGGELGFFNASMMVAPFSKAAFALKSVNDISDIVETQYGYHIIQLSGDRRSIDFYKDSIRDRLLRSSQRARLNEEFDRLSKIRKVEIFEENLAKLSPLPSSINADPETLVPKESGATSKP